MKAMKTYRSLMTAMAVIPLLFSSCKDSSKNDIVEDPYISVDPASFSTDYKGGKQAISVDANASWVITRTDEAGAAVDWVKLDKISGNGPLVMNILVEENDGSSDRKALLTFTAGDANAYFDVSQTGNPDSSADDEPVVPDPEIDPDDPDDPDDPVIPDDPDIPDDETVVLDFDFTGAALDGWPASDKYEHVDGGITCAYPLGGTSYDFVLADCDGASSARVYWNEGGYIAFGSFYRYLGVPVLEGYRLSYIVCTCPVAGKKFSVGIAGVIEANSTHPDAAGGHGFVCDPVAWDSAQDYEYNLAGSEAGKRYYIYCYKAGARLSKLSLTYSKAE